MKKKTTRIWSAMLLLLVVVLCLLTGCTQKPVQSAATVATQAATAAPKATTAREKAAPATKAPQQKTLDEKGSYTSKEDVALYLHLYGKLPDNFITKKEASALGWPGGDLRPYAKGKAIGGDRFGNYEGSLPSKKGRTYFECDIDTLKASSRGPKRIVYSNDGLIYYTADHYASFKKLY